ncbi:hypothetical protein GPECTOR_12g598 [Gonium pectorale]|uniref:Mediator complex subunit 18 n=1 Tax=Gonium pectorale TaxID=33097 RepID=A0A150GPA5_GONPE|nr:hypothetical protein GPECTOR_12g598 [Gonium pectorale]|eukprot:KXZ51634.1 hypothetical protein GPECTOR_12g598 [Gonium pectorale]
MSTAAAAATAAAGGGAGGLPAAAPSLTECRAVGVVERPEAVQDLAHLLRSLCASYSSHVSHTAVLRAPLPPPAGGGAPPGGTFTQLRLVRRLPGSLTAGHVVGAGGGAGGGRHPFLEEAPERWDVRHEGPPLQGPALNALPASMREVAEAGCWGPGALDFFKALGAKLEYDVYREGNEYNIVFHGYELKVVLATVYSLAEPGVLRDSSSIRRLAGRGLVAEAALQVPEGRHYEGASLLGAFAAQLAPYVKLGRAELPPGGAAAAAAAAAARRK